MNLVVSQSLENPIQYPTNISGYMYTCTYIVSHVHHSVHQLLCMQACSLSMRLQSIWTQVSTYSESCVQANNMLSLKEDRAGKRMCEPSSSLHVLDEEANRSTYTSYTPEERAKSCLQMLQQNTGKPFTAIVPFLWYHNNYSIFSHCWPSATFPNCSMQDIVGRHNFLFFTSSVCSRGQATCMRWQDDRTFCD